MSESQPVSALKVKPNIKEIVPGVILFDSRTFPGMALLVSNSETGKYQRIKINPDDVERFLHFVIPSMIKHLESAVYAVQFVPDYVQEEDEYWKWIAQNGNEFLNKLKEIQKIIGE